MNTRQVAVEEKGILDGYMRYFKQNFTILPFKEDAEPTTEDPEKIYQLYFKTTQLLQLLGHSREHSQSP